MTRKKILPLAGVLFLGAFAMAAEPIPSIPRRLPPPGNELDNAVRQQLEQKLRLLQQRSAPHSQHPLAPDIEVFLRAVELSLQFDEFYNDSAADRAAGLLDSAAQRLDAIRRGETPWTAATGLVVRGYRSSVDGSAQPYGLVIPNDIDLHDRVPLYIWLHGRGDKTTNLAFLHRRQTQAGTVTPDDAIVLHPWGRHCLGYKSAGEIDVLEAVDHVASQYNIDRRRIVLMGFSMGGAGCWHLGAHYTDRWVAMSPGAGFAETALYQSIEPDSVPWYERRLWGTYDVPAYVRNLFNLPVVAYSGEQDKQIQAARVMEQAFVDEDQKLPHLIGPGMGHKYHPDTLRDILQRMKTARDRGLELSPSRVTLQTRTLRYHRIHWVDVRGLKEHWRDSRVNAERMADGQFQLTTSNVTALRLSPQSLPDRAVVVIDGQQVDVIPNRSGTGQPAIALSKQNGTWSAGQPDSAALAKRPGLQGPIDDAFLEPFLVVVPSGECFHAAVQEWVEFEQARFLDRWQALFRGRARVKRDEDVSPEDFARYHLVLWGDPSSNRVLARIADRLPLVWQQDSIRCGEQRFPAAGHAVAMIYPNPESPQRYVVLNSGPTFREGHDRTNSLQNPKLPDWAVLDLSQPPDALSPGRIAAADFFDESWRVKVER
jgi:predicted esterase